MLSTLNEFEPLKNYNYFQKDSYLPNPKILSNTFAKPRYELANNY